MTFSDMAAPSYYPSATEIRMLRAIATIAVAEAARHGAYRATFHAFSVEALRCIGVRSGNTLMLVSLGVRQGDALIEYDRVQVDCHPLARLPLEDVGSGFLRYATIDGVAGHLR